MRRMTKAVLAAIAIAIALRDACAQSSGVNPSVDEALKVMQAEIEKLRGENQKMRGEIDELYAQSQDNWLTEARAEQIRELVQDVLSDADTRANLQSDGLTAGWSEHFFLASADGRFNLTFEGLMQIRWVYNYHDATDHHVNGFENSRTWLTFRGFVFTPDLQYLVRGDFSRMGGNNTLLDAWIRYNLDDNWSVRAGQFKLPFMREELIYDGYQQAVERSLVNELNSLRRSQGVEITWGAAYDRVSVATSDGGSPQLAGVVGGAHTNSPALNEDVEWAVTGRYEHLFAGNWDQFTDFTSPRGEEFGLMAGAAFHGQRMESTNNFGGSAETIWFGYTADVSVEFGGANIFAAWVHHYADQATASFHFYNIVVQGGLYIAPKWEIFARGEYSWVDIQFTGGNEPDLEDQALVTAGVNYYFEGHDVKWTTDFGIGLNRIESYNMSSLAGWRADPPGTGADPQIVFRTQIQLLF